VEELFKGHHFDREVIILCVRWYLLKLSLRDVVEMMAERGMSMAHDDYALGRSTTHWSSRSAGDDLLGSLVSHGESTRLTSRFEVNGNTCIGPLTGWQDGRLQANRMRKFGCPNWRRHDSIAT